MKFKGIYTPVITPCKADYSIDWDGLDQLLEHLVASGVHGIASGGTTGEYYAQTNEERIEVMRRTKEVVNGRVPVLGGVGALRTEDAVGFAQAARDIGVDGLLLGAPYYAVPTERELIRYALMVDQTADLPIMLYNFPDRTGTMMGREFLDRVGRSSNFCGIKEASGDPARVHMLAREYPHIQLCCGMDDQALEFFAWGAQCWVCAGSNFLPEEHVALCQACVHDKDYDLGRRMMKAFLPMLELMEGGGKFLQTVKYGCEIAGIPAGPPRHPLDVLTKDEARSVRTIHATLKTTFNALRQEQASANQ